MPETTEAAEAAETPGKRKLSDSKILFPSQEVELANGTRVVVEPWGLKKGALVLERLDLLTPKLIESGDLNARQLLARAWDEVVDLVSLTVDVPRDEMEAAVSDGGWTFEDLLRTTEALLDVCVLRSDGAGALPLLLSLVTRMARLAAKPSGSAIARRPSKDSEATEPSTAGSGNGSASEAETPKPA